jgi:4-hydroxy-3-polyprenylbenzoate decarboxylase
VEVTAITHRREAIYPTTIVGLPPQEDYYLGKATERVFLPLLRTLIHDIEDYDLPMYGAFHNAAFVKIKKSYPLQGRRVMHSVWGAGQMAWTKSIVVVDHDVDVHDVTAVLRRVAERCRPGRDTETVNGPLDILDHAAPRLGAGMKIGFDATKKIPGEEVAGMAVGADETHRPIGDAAAETILSGVSALPGVLEATLPEELARGWLFVRIDKNAAGQGRETIERIFRMLPLDREAGPAYVVVVGPDSDARVIDAAMFHFCAHADASRDAYAQADASGKVIRYAFDATPKLPGDEANGQPVRPWPPILRMDDDTRALVDRRWTEYGFKA